jgi:hypothetical protein
VVNIDVMRIGNAVVVVAIEVKDEVVREISIWGWAAEHARGNRRGREVDTVASSEVRMSPRLLYFFAVVGRSVQCVKPSPT